MRIVAIGGGQIGRGNTNYETEFIDNEIVSLTGKENPNFLFIGLASNFSDSYYKIIKDIYKNLGCNTGKISNKTLNNMEVVEQKIKQADIIYVGGGDTIKLVSILKQTGMDNMLYDAMQRNCVMAGISAGAILWCKHGLSDTEIINNISDKYVKIDALGFLDFMFVPHFDKDTKKEKDLIEVLKNTNIKALCFDDCTAIEIIDNQCKFIRSIEDKTVKKIYFKNNKLIKEELEFGKIYKECYNKGN